jgi:hypothetical protein
MKSEKLLENFVAAAVLAAVAVVWCGCQPDEPAKPGKSEPKQAAKQESPAATGEKAVSTAKPVAAAPATTQSDTGTLTISGTLSSGTSEPAKGETPAAGKETKAVEAVPLVDNMADLTKIDHCSPAWIDKKNKTVVLVGETCQASYPLEFFATLPDRDYESVVVVTTPPYIVHAALIVLGAKPGHPVKFEPKFEPATGTEVGIEVRWKDKDGKVKNAPAQQWIRNIQTKKALDTNWVFAGSILRKDPQTGKEDYLANHGDFVSVLNLPMSTLDLPIRSTGAMESRLFEGFIENMPPAKTPVTIIFKPKVTKEAAADPDATKWMQDMQKDKGGMKSGADSVFPPTGPDDGKDDSKDEEK